MLRDLLNSSASHSGDDVINIEEETGEKTLSRPTVLPLIKKERSMSTSSKQLSLDSTTSTLLPVTGIHPLQQTTRTDMANKYKHTEKKGTNIYF